jgi:hypothetical protein
MKRSQPPSLTAFAETNFHSLLRKRPRPDEAPMDLPGQLQLALGTMCRVERELGRGGMAMVAVRLQNVLSGTYTRLASSEQIEWLK